MSKAVRIGRRGAEWAVLILALLTAGCATTRAYQRERLGDRIMTFDGDAKESARRAKALDAREGSTGGTGGAGGGCACN